MWDAPSRLARPGSEVRKWFGVVVVDDVVVDEKREVEQRVQKLVFVYMN